jgi:hypothetical protein
LKKTQPDGHVDTEDATFNWVIGTDGAQSLVRKTGGFSYMGETKRDRPLAVGDIIITKGLSQVNLNSSVSLFLLICMVGKIHSYMGWRQSNVCYMVLRTIRIDSTSTEFY